MIAATEPLLFRAEVTALGDMDAWLTAFAADHGLPDDVREELRVCLHELAANVIMHGGCTDRPATIVLSGRMDDGATVLDFADDAMPFDPLVRPTGPATGGIEEVAIGGLGLHLVRRFTDRLSYRHDGHWNRLPLVRGPR